MILLLLSLFKSALQRKLVLLFNVSQSSNLFCGTQDIHSPETHWSFVGSRKAEATLAICSRKRLMAAAAAAASVTMQSPKKYAEFWRKRTFIMF
jgi:hypothetical protein